MYDTYPVSMYESYIKILLSYIGHSVSPEGRGVSSQHYTDCYIPGIDVRLDRKTYQKQSAVSDCILLQDFKKTETLDIRVQQITRATNYHRY